MIMLMTSLRTPPQINYPVVTTHAWVILSCNLGSIMPEYSKLHSLNTIYAPLSPAIVSQIHDLGPSFVSCARVQLPDA